MSRWRDVVDCPYCGRQNGYNAVLDPNRPHGDLVRCGGCGRHFVVKVRTIIEQEVYKLQLSDYRELDHEAEKRQARRPL